jgi:hypothetical protein
VTLYPRGVSVTPASLSLGFDPMTRKKTDPPAARPDAAADPSGTETIRVPIDLADMIRQICAHYRQVHGRKIKATDYLNQALRERVQRDHAEIMAKVGRKPAP